MRLGELQLDILRVLWDRGESTVAEVQKALPRGDALAYTTVATMLRKMEVRGLLTHREDGRRFVYAAAVTERQVSTDLTGDLLERVFEGRLADMVSHLLSTRDVSAAELDELERLVKERRKKK
jgi:predicted transcriptional regulator